MSRDRKFFLNWYGYTDAGAQAARLEKLHARGWHLESTAFGGWHFRRGEGEKVRYTVTYFPGASVYDPRPTEDQMTYADYCAQEGWEFVCAYGPIQYFRSTRPDPVPIETDEREKLRAIHKTVLKTQGPSWLCLSAFVILLLWLMLATFSRRPLEFAASNTMLGACLLEGSFLLYQLWNVGGYWLWYTRSRLSGKCPAGGRLWMLGTWVLIAVMLALLALNIFLSENRWVQLLRLALYALLMFGCRRLLLALKRRGGKREDVRASYLTAAVIAAVLFTVGMRAVEAHARTLASPGREPAYVYTTPMGYDREVYLDALPVTLEDLGVPVAEEDHYSYLAEEERSILAVRSEYDQSAWPGADMDGNPGLYYSVTEIPWDWLREWCWRRQVHFYRNITFEVVDDPRWGAVEVRKGSDDTQDRYMLLYGDRIVLVFVSGMELTDEQVAILVQRLVPAKRFVQQTIQ